RFDFFSRSADEAYREYDERRRVLPTMRVEERVLLHFPTTRYFFVQRSADGQKIAERIEAGLETLVRSGAFDAHFLRYKGALIARSQSRPADVNRTTRARPSRASGSRVTSPQASHWSTRSAIACLVMPARPASSVRREPSSARWRVTCTCAALTCPRAARLAS